MPSAPLCKAKLSESELWDDPNGSHSHEDSKSDMSYRPLELGMHADVTSRCVACYLGTSRRNPRRAVSFEYREGVWTTSTWPI